MASSRTSRRSSRFLSLAAQATAAFINLAPSTLASYNKTIGQFYSFILTLDSRFILFPASSGQVCLFATELYNQGLSPASITSKLSALSFIHQIYDKPDPVNSFIVSRTMRHFRKLRPQQDLRLPVTPSLLSEMLHRVSCLGFNFYDELLYKAMLALSFAAYLRPGEITGSSHNLLRQNFKFAQKCIVIKFASFKHSVGQPFILKVRPTGMSTCPVRLMRKYLEVRKGFVGPLFRRLNGLPVSYSQYSTMFRSIIATLGLQGKYSPHSMRIGAATYAAAAGYTDAQIRAFGRWNSSAFRSYLRFPIVQI